jgi:hypothetical protein
VIVVCERNGEIRNIKIPVDETIPVKNEPLAGRYHGMGKSKLLGTSLPKFLVPGNTCPLYPITPYLKANICPVDGNHGIQATIIGRQ